MFTFADSLDTIQSIKDHEKSLDPQLWHACAGGMVQMPLVHSKVYFFPQGYMEHASNGTHLDLPIAAARVPPMILCSVQSIKYLADSNSDEVYAKIRLAPIQPEETELGDDEDGFGSIEKDKPASFAKTLTQSDANNGGGFSVPRYCAETIFPRLDYSADPPVQTVLAKDVHGEIWKFRHIYRGTPRRHLLTTGWSTFVNQKKLVAGDSIVFLRVENGDLYVGIRRAKRGGIGAPDPITPLPGYGNFCNAAREKGRIRVESVMEAINLAVNGRPFEVIYYPRASTPEFVVRAGSVQSAMRVGWCPGMRFKMAFETEDSSRISWFMGTVNSVQVADPVRWPNSPWRLLQVTWDEPDLLQNVKRVSPWLVELVSTIPPIHMTPFSPASPMPPRKKPRIIPLEGQFPVFSSGFHGGPMFPFPEVAVTSTGIQGARHSAPFGISLPDISLFNRPGGGPHHLLNSIGMAHQLSGGPHHFTVPSPTGTPTKARDAVSCLHTLHFLSFFLYFLLASIPKSVVIMAEAPDEVKLPPAGEGVEEEEKSVKADEPEAVAPAQEEPSDGVDSPPPPPPSVPEAVERSLPSVGASQPKSRRLFGREKPVHQVLGGGKTADVLLWRDKKSASGALAGATSIWVLFELLDFRLLTLLSYCFMFTLGALFVVSKLMTWIRKAPLRIPDVHIPEDKARRAAYALRNDINRVLSLLRDVALGRDLKKFLMVIAGLYVLSVVGSWFDFLTLSYIGFILLHTVPVLYEKYEDKVDEFAERGMVEMNKHYKVLDDKVLSKIPRGPQKSKKVQ